MTDKIKNELLKEIQKKLGFEAYPLNTSINIPEIYDLKDLKIYEDAQNSLLLIREELGSIQNNIHCCDKYYAGWHRLHCRSGRPSMFHSTL